MPEETLNVLVGALAEGEIHVPRLGRIPAEPSFRLIAAMNPFDAVGTARVSQAIADRMCRIAIGYQDAPGERRDRRARARAPTAPLSATAVELTRLTREHAAGADGRRRCAGRSTSSGSAAGSARCAASREPVPGDATFADAAVAALSGRLRLEEGCERTPEEIVLELIERLKPAPEPKEPDRREKRRGRPPPEPAGR